MFGFDWIPVKRASGLTAGFTVIMVLSPTEV